jgi:hypothetical protein
MTLPWIKINTDLPEHPKSLALEADLGEPMAWAYVVRLWLWAARVRPSGDLADCADAVLARVSGYAGEPRRFVEGLAKAGFLDEDGRLHAWDEYQGAHLAKLARDRERLRRLRQESRDSRATVARHRTTSHDVAGEKVAGERRGEEKEKDPPVVPQGGRDAGEGAVVFGSGVPPRPEALDRNEPSAAASGPPSLDPPGPATPTWPDDRSAIQGHPEQPARKTRAKREAPSHASLDALLADTAPSGRTYAVAFADRWPELDGLRGRPTIRETCEAAWAHQARRKSSDCVAYLRTWLAREAKSYRVQWERSNETAAHARAESERPQPSRAAPAPSRPVADDGLWDAA